MNITYNELEEAYDRASQWKSKRSDVRERNKDFKPNMRRLYTDLCNNQYVMSPTRRVIISDPVTREIIVLAFRDRIVQHLVHHYISPLREKRFIHDSYSNRVGKGTLAGIQRVDHFMRSCSHNYTKDCYVMKLDIQSCFLSVDRQILRELIYARLRIIDVSRDKRWLLRLIQLIIFHDYCKDYIDHTTYTQRSLLPPHKSLFFVPKSQGMPLGNLTSQLFANIYLHELDQFVKHTLKIKYYARYVDDFILFHTDKDYLLICYKQIKIFLYEKLKMTLHPHKFYLQHYRRWVKFLGVMIYPYYRVVGKRIISNCFSMISHSYKESEQKYNSLMSYNGSAIYHKCYKLRQQRMSQYINSLGF